MSIEDQVLALIEEGNPIPDPETIDNLPAEPAAYLATLQTRSSEVIQLEEKRETREGRGSWWIAIAAVVVVLLGVAVFVWTQGDDEPPVATQPPAETGTIEGYWEQGTTQMVFEEERYFIIEGGGLSDTGRYTTVGDELLQLRSLEGTVSCEPLDGGAWDYAIADDTLTLIFSTDDCNGGRGLGIGRLTLDRVDPFAIPISIEGYWSGPEADFFFGDSEYAIVIDGALSDSGSYQAGIRESDNRIVTITSGDETVDCSPGDVAIINYDLLDDDTVQLSGTSVDDCGLRGFLDVEILRPTDPFEIPEP